MVAQQQQQDLIPGLPEDVARECLIRVPYHRFHTARSVCKHWAHELDSADFHRRRNSSGLARPIVALAQADPPSSQAAATDKPANPSPPTTYSLTIFDPTAATWASLAPPAPGGLPLFCRVAAVGRALVVIGGWDPRTWAASDAVYVYDLGRAVWRRGARMPGPRRSFFACAASHEGQGVVVVAGGHDERKNALSSALAYDVGRDEWAPLPDMARDRDECRGVFLRGKFHVVGGYETDGQGRFQKSAEAFDFATWEWGPVEEGFLQTGTCPGTCVAGQDGRLLYMCQEGHVAVQDADGTWKSMVALPEDVRVALQMVAWEGKLMVVGSGSHGGAQIGYFLELEGKEGMRWRKVEMPPEYSGHVQAGCSVVI